MGFYITNIKEKNLFENLQEQIEQWTEILHGLLELEITPFLDVDNFNKDKFYMWKGKVNNMISVTMKQLKDFLRDTQTGLQNTKQEVLD